MTIGAAELKLGFELFSKLMTWVGGKRRTKKVEALKSQAFQELLKGDSADLNLVSSILKELAKAADTTPKTERLKTLYRTVSTSSAKKVAKKPARKRAATKKPAAKKATKK